MRARDPEQSGRAAAGANAHTYYYPNEQIISRHYEDVNGIIIKLHGMEGDL